MTNDKVDFNIEYAHIYLSEQSFESRVFIKNYAENIKITKQIIRDLELNDKTYSLNVLIDDYNPSISDADLDQIYHLLDECDLPPDHIMLESEFTNSSAEKLIDLIDSRYLEKGIHNESIFKVKTNNVHLWSNINKSKSPRSLFLENPRNSINQPLSKKSNTTHTSFNTCHAKSEIILKNIENGVAYYACPLLNACWQLMRLGVDPFSEEISNLSSFSSKSFIGDTLITIEPTKLLKIEATSLEIISLTRKKKMKRLVDKIQFYFH